MRPDRAKAASHSVDPPMKESTKIRIVAFAGRGRRVSCENTSIWRLGWIVFVTFRRPRIAIRIGSYSFSQYEFTQ